MSKCDLHIHSRFSARSEEWLFRRLDFPDSYSDPRELHRELLARGMDFVTITDHDTIDGCLAIRDLPNTFISEQVTTYFPQDPCKIHILVWGIAQKQHDDIVIIRDNIFALQRYLQGAKIAHAVTHPLYSINGKLESSHLERLILLFKHFEGINGWRDALLSALAHGFYNTVACFIQDHFHEKLGPSGALIEQMFSRFMEGRDPTEFTLAEKASFIAQGVLSGKIFELAKPANMSLWKELSGYFARPEVKAKLAEQLSEVPEAERRTFMMANMVSEQLAFRFFQKFVQQISTGNMLESVQALTAMAPILIILAPYIYGSHSHAPSRKWLQKIFQELTGKIPEALQNNKRAWFTDTLEDVNGVATTIRKMTAAGAAAGKELTVITSRDELTVDDIPIKNFKPIGEFELPEYELQKLSFPPILQILDYIQRERFTEVIISTPGPIGLTALLAAKMLNLQTSGIYHTDFPQYVRILTEDSFLESVTWRYMHWFYGQLDTVFVNSEEYRDSWIKRR